MDGEWCLRRVLVRVEEAFEVAVIVKVKAVLTPSSL